MKRLVALLLPVLFVLPSTSAIAGPPDGVLAAERAWLDAYEQLDASAIEKIVAEGFVITYQDGNTQSKGDIVTWIRRAATSGRKGSKIATEGTKVSAFGDHTVVLKGIVITQRIVNGEPSIARSLYTDTWVVLDGRWQVVASHLSTAPAQKS